MTTKYGTLCCCPMLLHRMIPGTAILVMDEEMLAVSQHMGVIQLALSTVSKSLQPYDIGPVTQPQSWQ